MSDDEAMIDELRSFDAFFQSQQDVLRELAKLAFEAGPKDRLNSIYPLLDSIQTSAYSITLLLRHGLITECYILGRTYLERLVNACYLLVCEKKDFDDYIDFSMQKVQRALETRRLAFLAIGKTVDTPDLSSISFIAKGKEKFTSPRGKEITRWTTLNIEKRIEFVKMKCLQFDSALFLAISKFIYEDASEAVHGTLYGSLFHSGLFYGMNNATEAEAYLNSLRRTMYMLLGLLSEGILVVASERMPTEQLIAKSKLNFEKLQPYFERSSKNLA